MTSRSIVTPLVLTAAFAATQLAAGAATVPTSPESSAITVVTTVAAPSAAPSAASAPAPSAAASAAPSTAPSAAAAKPAAPPKVAQAMSPAPVSIPAVTAPPAGASSNGTMPGSGLPPVVLPQADRGPYLGSDGAYHFPADGRATLPTLSCVPLFVCDVTLEDSEQILNVATGDSARWLIASANSGPGGTIPHVLIKPTTLGLRTNLVVTTTRRTYYLMLNSAATTPYSRLTYFYPDDEAAAAAALANQERQRELAREAELPLRPVGPVDTAFRMYGDSQLLPYKIYADSVHTFIEYAKTPVDLPTVYEVSTDGNDQIVNFRFKDGIFIIDGTPRDIDLVLNAGTGRHGSGERRVHIRHN